MLHAAYVFLYFVEYGLYFLLLRIKKRVGFSLFVKSPVHFFLYDKDPLPKSKAEVTQLCRRRSIHLRTTGVERNKGIYNGPLNRCAILFCLSNGISPSWSNRMSVEIVSFLSVLIEIVLDAHNCDVSCFPLFSRRMRMADRMSGLSGTVISSLFEGRKDERYFQSVPASISRLRSFSKYSSVLLHSFSCCL